MRKAKNTIIIRAVDAGGRTADTFARAYGFEIRNSMRVLKTIRNPYAIAAANTMRNPMNDTSTKVIGLLMKFHPDIVLVRNIGRKALHNLQQNGVTVRFEGE